METCKVDIAILTVIPPELAAAKAALGIQDISNNRTKTQDSQTIYLHGELFSERTQRNYRVALGCIGNAGNYNSSQAATEVIQAHDPKLILLVGIAAGIEGKAKLGEVVFSERVLGYESAALRQLENGTQTIQPRPDMTSVPNGIHQDVIFYLASHKDPSSDSQQRLESRFFRIGGKFPMLSVQDRSYLQENNIIGGIEIDVCTVASGEKLLKDPSVLENIRDNQHGRVKVGEMEAIGFANACQKMRRDWLVIRGVSDFGDADKSDVFHSLASQTAATVLADFLQYGLDLPPSNSKVSTKRDSAEFNRADIEVRLQKCNDSQLEEIIRHIQVDKKHIRMKGTKYQIIADLVDILEDDPERLHRLQSYLK